MQKITVRYLILITILIIFSGLTFYLNFHQKKRISSVNNIAGIPIDFNGWKGEEIHIDKSTKDFLEAESVLLRKYTKGDLEVWFFIVYNKNSRIALNLPESYYSGHSSYIAKIGLETLHFKGQNPFSANKLLVKDNKGKLLVLYYFETPDIKTYSYQAMRWNMLLSRLKSKHHDGALIRYSAVVKVNQEETLKVLKNFIEEIGPLLSVYLN